MARPKKIPKTILDAVNALLAPYGVDIYSLLQATRDKKQSDGEERRSYMEVKTAAHEYGISRWTIGRLIKSRQISASKLSDARSGKVLIERTSLENYIKAHSYA